MNVQQTKYIPSRTLCEGSFGTIYHVSGHPRKVLKRVHEDQMTKEEFRNEIDMATIAHATNIGPKVFQTWWKGNQGQIVMQKLGQDLNSYYEHPRKRYLHRNIPHHIQRKIIDLAVKSVQCSRIYHNDFLLRNICFSTTNDDDDAEDILLVDYGLAKPIAPETPEQCLVYYIGFLLSTLMNDWGYKHRTKKKSLFEKVVEKIRLGEITKIKHISSNN